MNEEDVNPRKKQNCRETAGSTGNEAPRYPSEERARNPKEQQLMETRRKTPQPKERIVQRTVTPQEEGEGQEREREKVPVRQEEAVEEGDLEGEEPWRKTSRQRER